MNNLKRLNGRKHNILHDVWHGSGWFHGVLDIALGSSQRGGCYTQSKVLAINKLPLTTRLA